MFDDETQKGNISSRDYPWHAEHWQQLSKSREDKHLAHAILLSGMEGIGKIQFADRLAKALLCINAYASGDDACNTCQSCMTYESGANPDFTQINLLEDKQQIGVDQIRALSHFLTYSRSYNTYRVVVINPLDRLNNNAANSLLKSLEEPASHTIIILLTANVNKLLPTIKSRCQIINMSTPSKSVALDWLKEQSIQDDLPITLEKLLEISHNRPLNALKINADEITERSQFLNDVYSVVEHKKTVTEVAKSWEKYDFEKLIDWQIILIQTQIKAKMINGSSDSAHNSAQILFKHLSTEELWQLHQNVIELKKYIHTSVNSLMFVENMLMLWTKTI